MATLNTRIVIRNDSTTNWLTNESAVLLKGEVGIEFLADGKVKMKVGDGTKTWAQLSYFGGEESKTFQVSSLDEITETELAIGDTAIVKTVIYVDAENEANNKYSYTGYVYNGTEWTAMDGNYNAENVYFDEDLLTTSAVGNISLTNGQATISAAGKNLKQVFNTIFVKESNPSITQPSVSISLTGAGAKEVGTSFTPSYSITFNPGSYQYGPDTGVTATYAVSDTNSNTATTATGSFAAFTVDTATNYKVSVTATHTGGATPVTNVGNDYAAGVIVAGTKTAASSAVTGYRGWFCGYYNGTDAIADPTDITSEQIRAFGVRNGSFVTSMSTTNMQQMFFAAPQGVVASVGVANSVNGAPQTVSKTTVNVEGANSFEAVAYDVFYVSNAVAESGASTFKITTTKA